MPVDDQTYHALLAEVDALRRRVAELEHHTEQGTSHILRVILDAIPVPIFYKDTTGAYLGCNTAFERYLGRGKDEIIGTTAYDLAPPDLAETSQKADQQLIEHQNVQTYTTSVTHADGTQHEVIFNKAVFYNSDGTVGGLVGTMFDITEQVRIEHELRTFKALAENAPDSISVIDLAGTITYANRAFQKQFGCDQPPLGSDIGTFIAEERDMIRSLVSSVLERGSWSGTLRCRRGDGSTFTGQLSALPIDDNAGQPIAVAGIIRDVTEQIRRSTRIETALQQHQRLTQSLLDNLPAAVYVKDEHGRYILINRATEAFYGHSREEILGKTDAELLPPETTAALKADEQTVRATGQVVEREISVTHDGAAQELLMVRFPLYDEQGVLYAIGGITTDISDQRRAEQERIMLQEQVIEAQRAVLREVSTPLIPLANEVVVMPLVGAIDSTRAQQIMETLLEGIVAYQADVAIIDITGVRVVDTQVADALLRAARAARLLGAGVVLTGISADVAQAMVHLGADLSEIATLRDLQSGIAFAVQEHVNMGLLRAEVRQDAPAAVRAPARALRART